MCYNGDMAEIANLLELQAFLQLIQVIVIALIGIGILLYK